MGVFCRLMLLLISHKVCVLGDNLSMCVHLSIMYICMVLYKHTKVFN